MNYEYQTNDAAAAQAEYAISAFTDAREKNPNIDPQIFINEYAAAMTDKSEFNLDQTYMVDGPDGEEITNHEDFANYESAVWSAIDEVITDFLDN